uniref:AAA+ ATPase domain-containing protein n=1 Tax=Otus sunia TaxID=257818 RepID=A0A8C8BTJ0_9STRI
MQAFLKGLSSISTKPLAAKERGAAEISPKNVDEVAFQDEVVAVLKESLEGADLPSLLFYSPPGTGRTSTIFAAARELYGPELFWQRVLVLNASDEYGIQVIWEKVKAFAQLTASGSCSDGKICPPFKIVILDEADAMTSAAQAALRRTEKESKTTHFCLICNYIIIPKETTDELLSVCQSGSFEKLETLAKNLINEGYAVAQLVNQLDKQKSVIVKKLVEVDKWLADGADIHFISMLNPTSSETDSRT